jgi:hypothetical protein
LFAFSATGKAQQSNTVEARNAQTNRLRVIAGGEAQQPNVAQAVYNKWRKEASADEVSKLRFALASVTRRINDEVAEVELWAVSGNSQSVFEIQPQYYEKYQLGGLRGLPQDLNKLKQEQTEEIPKTVVGSPSSVGLRITIPVRPNTNALEIKWFGDTNGTHQFKTAVTVFLETRDKPVESLTWGTDRGIWTLYRSQR